MIRIIEIAILICCAGFFDGLMDMIKDFHLSYKNWLWSWMKGHPAYTDWYQGQHSIPWMEKHGYIYNPKYLWTSDAWHSAKHFMLLSFAGAIATALNLGWYYQIGVWWIAYWIEGMIFNLVYQRLK